MAQRHAQGIARIGLELAGKIQQYFDHVLHLYLVRAALADDGLLDLAGGVFMHRQARHQHRAEGSPSGLAEFQRGVGVLVHEHLLNRQFIGFILADDIDNAVVNLLEPVGKGVGLGADATTGHQHRTLGCGVNQAVAGGAGAWVDAEDAGQAIFSRISSLMSALE